jgi:hypothetical protein
MNMKKLTLIFVILLAAGMVLSVPVASVHAKTATQFTGTGETTGVLPGTVVKQMGVNELVVGTEISAEHIWDSSPWVAATFGRGDIVNTVDSINNIDTQHNIMKGTHVLTFDSGIVLTGTVHAVRLLVDGKGFVTIGTWVSSGGGYKVIWHFDSRLERQDYGVIIEL